MDVIFDSVTLKDASTIHATATYGDARYEADFAWHPIIGAFVIVHGTTRVIVIDPPPVCGPGEVMLPSDLVWDLHAVQLWPIPAVSGSGDSGRAIQFVADAVRYPLGIRVNFVDETYPQMPKDYVISTCPHNFTPAHPNGQNIGVASYGGLYLRFGPAIDPWDCALTPGQTYYINFRDYAVPRSTVSSQFVCYARTE